MNITKNGISLVVLPELATTGVVMVDENSGVVHTYDPVEYGRKREDMTADDFFKIFVEIAGDEGTLVYSQDLQLWGVPADILEQEVEAAEEFISWREHLHSYSQPL